MVRIYGLNFIMKRTYLIFALTVYLGSLQASAAMRFFGDPPDANHPWAMHDENRPQMPVVQSATEPGGAPSDAIVLFDGTEESFEQNWIHIKEKGKRRSDWKVVDGALQCAPGAGYIGTKEMFGDVQLHIEWTAPTPVKGTGQQRGNSGVFLMELIEVQVLDNYQNPTYADGTAGAVYGLMPPQANALNPVGEWQSYDIIFRRPVTRNGEVINQGSITVLCNGVVVQDHVALNGGGGWKHRTPLDRVFPEEGRLSLQDHGNPVRYRNIWIRPLRPREYDGGFDGRLSEATTMAKRAEIAAEIRADAAKLSGMDQANRLLESLVYAEDASALRQSDQLVRDYMDKFKVASPEQIEAQRSTVKGLEKAYSYLIRHKRLSADHFALPALQAISNEQGWNKRR